MDGAIGAQDRFASPMQTQQDAVILLCSSPRRLLLLNSTNNWETSLLTLPTQRLLEGSPLSAV